MFTVPRKLVPASTTSTVLPRLPESGVIELSVGGNGKMPNALVTVPPEVFTLMDML
jgi:hypothetical protein